MKLNLSPFKDPEDTRVRKVFLTLSVLGIFCLGGVVSMVRYSADRLQQSRDEYDLLYNDIENIRSVVHRTDRLWRGSEDLATNLELYKTIQAHNSTGIELIEKIVRYIPSFFRVTSIQVYPYDQLACQIHISGVLKTYQEYADLMVSLMQVPKVQKAFRLPVVLKKSESAELVKDQTLNSEIIDPIEKMAAQIALAQPSIVNPLTGHKVGAPLPPLNQDGSEVSVILVLGDTPYKVPNVRFTLSGAGNQPLKEKQK